MYIVTGGAGFIGSAMIWKLNSLGIDSILVVDNLAKTEKWKNLVNRSFDRYMHRDDFFTAMTEGHIKQPVEAIFHLGACSATTERDADFLMRNNLEYTKTICNFARQKRARFINASSAATYGDGTQGFDDDIAALHHLRPLNMYGYSKHLFDLWARRNNILDEIVCLKYFNVYGPNEQHKGDMRSVVNKSFHQITAEGLMRLFKSNVPEYDDGGQMRDFVYIKDCVDIMWWLAEHSEVNGIFNLGTGKARSWNDLVTAVFNAMGKTPAIDYIPMPDHLLGKYQNFTQANMQRLRESGYTKEFTSLEDGVTDYVQNYLMQADSYL